MTSVITTIIGESGINGDIISIYPYIDASIICYWTSLWYTVGEIAQKLQVGQSTIDNDLLYFIKQAQDSLQKHIHEVVSEEYQKCMVGMKRNLKQTLEIAETASNPKIKLENSQ